MLKSFDCRQLSLLSVVLQRLQLAVRSQQLWAFITLGGAGLRECNPEEVLTLGHQSCEGAWVSWVLMGQGPSWEWGWGWVPVCPQDSLRREV